MENVAEFRAMMAAGKYTSAVLFAIEQSEQDRDPTHWLMLAQIAATMFAGWMGGK